MSTIGERIKKVRDAKGYTQGDVAMRLNVVHTTVSDYEKQSDLKISAARKIATVLEVDDRLLTDAASDLDIDDVAPVVRREALRLFIKELSLKPRERQRYERIVQHLLAPTTVAGWHELRDLILRFLGRPPGSRVTATRNDEASRASSGPEPKGRKRMVRVTVDQMRRSLRRVG